MRVAADDECMDGDTAVELSELPPSVVACGVEQEGSAAAVARGSRSIGRSVTGRRGGDRGARFCGLPFQSTAGASAAAGAGASSSSGGRSLGSGGGAGTFAQRWPRSSLMPGGCACLILESCSPEVVQRARSHAWGRCTDQQKRTARAVTQRTCCARCGGYMLGCVSEWKGT